MPLFTSLHLPAAIRAEVVAHARECAPLECCGVLAGRIADGVGVVTTSLPVANDLHSPIDYLTNPRDLLAAFRAMRTAGTELLAIYHSHPASEPVPSARDLAGNTYGESVVHLIVGLVGGEADVRAWWLAPDSFREAELVVAASGS